MKKSLFLFFCFVLFHSYAQEAVQEITGTVVDASSGMPIPGVNVIEKGTTNGVVTDFNGEFTIEVPGNATLVFSYLGFAQQTVPVNGQTELNITLEPKASALEEVVLVAYGTQKKENLTGAISTVETENLTSRPVSSTQNALQGLTAGLTVLQRPGDVGSTASITIRGRSNLGSPNPMFIIDGVPASATEFAALNSNDIAKMSVLKDAASAALYGSRAANGVILVKTKRGTGDKTSVNINAWYAWQSATRTPNYVGSADYARLHNEALTNAGRTPTFSEEEIALFESGENPDLYPNTNWRELVLRETAPQRQVSVGISTPGEFTDYYLSLTYFDQESLIPYKQQDRIVARLNTDSQIVEDLLEVGTNFSFINNGFERKGNMSWVDLNRSLPTTVFKQSNGDWGSINTGEINAQNASINQMRLIEEGGEGTDENNFFNMSANATLTPLEGLSINGMTSLEYSFLNSWDFKHTVAPVNDFFTGEPIASTAISTNEMTEYWRKRKEFLIQGTVNYEKRIGDHFIKAVLGASQEENIYRVAFLGRKNFPNNDMTTIGTGSTSPEDISSDEDGQANRTVQDEWAIRSFFGQVNYSFADKYLLQANARIDYSSRFHPDERRAVFPSFSAGWIISEESFMEDVDWLNLLKIKGSWGTLGNQEVVSIGNYFDILNSGYAYSFSGNPVDGVWQSRGANKEATWEEVSMLNLGLNMTMFDNRLSLSSNYYIKETSGILTRLPVLNSFGLPTVPYVNAASTRNKGLELAINYSDYIGADFNFSIGANLSSIDNEILSLGDGVQQRINGLWIERVGGTVGDFYGYKTDGLFVDEADVENHAFQSAATSPGDIKYVDLNQDGEINADDRTVIGNDVPWLNYGFNLSAEYKGFDLAVIAYGVGNVEVYLSGEAAYPFFNGAGIKEELKDRWTIENPNPNAAFPRLLTSQDASHNYRTSDFWLFDASYFRIRSLSLGYTVPTELTEKIGFRNIRVYSAATNPFTIMFDDRLTDYDPESASGRGGYPGIKTISLGFSLNF